MKPHKQWAEHKTIINNYSTLECLGNPPLAIRLQMKCIMNVTVSSNIICPDIQKKR